MCLAIPGRIKAISSIDGTIRKAKVIFGHIVKEAYLDMIPQAKVGDYVLVHAGVAINIVNEQEAKRTYQYLEKYGGLEDLIPEHEIPN